MQISRYSTKDIFSYLRLEHHAEKVVTKPSLTIHSSIRFHNCQDAWWLVSTGSLLCWVCHVYFKESSETIGQFTYVSN